MQTLRGRDGWEGERVGGRAMAAGSGEGPGGAGRAGDAVDVHGIVPMRSQREKRGGPEMTWGPAPVQRHRGARAEMPPALCRAEGAVTLRAVVVTISQSHGPRSEPRAKARGCVPNHTSRPRHTDRSRQVKGV